MKIEKKVLTQLDRCYATNAITLNGRLCILFATEGHGACFGYYGKNFESQLTVWDEPGGTMSFVPLEGRNGEFLAVQNFFRLYQWENAKVVWVRPQANGSFLVSDVLHMPYIHRFDVLPSEGKHYFIGCTLATAKDSREDWSTPGNIYVAQLPEDLTQPLKLDVLKEGMFKNHGYSRSVWNGVTVSIIACEQGAFVVAPPKRSEGWRVTQIMDWPISDIATADIDGDGELEIATIEPFHGCHFRVYKKIGGNYKMIYEHPEVSEFYHVAVGGMLRNRPIFIGGCRRGKQQLFYIDCCKKSPLILEAKTIEEGVGPSNAIIINEPDRDIIACANREKGEAALYIISD